MPLKSIKAIDRALCVIHMHTLELFQSLLRLAGIVASLCFVLPFWSHYQRAIYYSRALRYYILAWSIRLFQRLPKYCSILQYCSDILKEDSCHHIIYCLIMSNTMPMTIVVFPMGLYASLQLTSFLSQLILPYTNKFTVQIRPIITKILIHQREILRAIALCELLLFPILIFCAFTKRAALFTPIGYYNFIRLRYNSKRNPYTRETVSSLMNLARIKINTPACPSQIKSYGNSILDFISNRL
ncbi:hypothetical protein GJ496_004477 [Pomphorhynchus laevis]|nr:hypothetical protein GJ496_004477 [Pomphorhynchus laevis]